MEHFKSAWYFLRYNSWQIIYFDFSQFPQIRFDFHFLSLKLISYILLGNILTHLEICETIHRNGQEDVKKRVVHDHHKDDEIYRTNTTCTNWIREQTSNNYCSISIAASAHQQQGVKLVAILGHNAKR